MSNYYTVEKGDTLSKIAIAHKTTVDELVKLNQIENPNRLVIGQRLALTKEVVLGVQPLFLDTNRDPIPDLDYVLATGGQIINGTTSKNGLGKKALTATANDEVRVFVNRLDGTLKEVGKAVSGYGNKLLTLISPCVKVTGKTEKHPELNHGEQPSPKEPIKPAYDPNAKQSPTGDKKDLGLRTTDTKTPDGKPLVVVTGDIPDLGFLGEYVGGEVTDRDIEAAAEELECEPGLIYAIAKQESAHSSFIKLFNRTVPTILYERHWFRKLTKPDKKSPSPYEEKYYDICGNAYHKTKIKKTVSKDKSGKKTITRDLIDLTTGSIAVADDVYGPPGLSQYKRLTKAYQLDKSAALQSCSWGKFQIMGFNYKNAGYPDVFSFVKGMSSGDPAHIRAFLKFARNNPVLLDGLRNKDYEKIAEGHNGASWRSVNADYASNIEKFSKDYRR